MFDPLSTLQQTDRQIYTDCGFTPPSPAIARLPLQQNIFITAAVAPPAQFGGDDWWKWFGKRFTNSALFANFVQYIGRRFYNWSNFSKADCWCYMQYTPVCLCFFFSADYSNYLKLLIMISVRFCLHGVAIFVHLPFWWYGSVRYVIKLKFLLSVGGIYFNKGFPLIPHKATKYLQWNNI